MNWRRLAVWIWFAFVGFGILGAARTPAPDSLPWLVLFAVSAVAYYGNKYLRPRFADEA